MSKDSNSTTKDTIWQSGLKRKIQQSCLQETHLINRNKHWLRVKGWKKIYQANGIQNKAGVAILILHKVDFKLTMIKCDEEVHFIIVKGEIHQKEITIINLYVPNLSELNFNKQTLKDLKANLDSKKW
jgi:exonuclease III